MSWPGAASGGGVINIAGTDYLVMANGALRALLATTELQPSVWASREVINITQGDTQRMTDLGPLPGALFRWNGTRHRREYPFTIGAGNVGSVASPMFTLSGAASGVLTPTTQLLLPAALLTIGDRFMVNALVRKSGATATWDLNAYLGTAGTTADSLIKAETTIAATTGRTAFFAVPVLVTGETTVTTYGGMTWNGTGGGAVVDRSTNINVASAMYVTLAIANGNASDSYQLLQASIEVL